MKKYKNSLYSLFIIIILGACGSYNNSQKNLKLKKIFNYSFSFKNYCPIIEKKNCRIKLITEHKEEFLALKKVYDEGTRIKKLIELNSPSIPLFSPYFTIKKDMEEKVIRKFKLHNFLNECDKRTKDIISNYSNEKKSDKIKTKKRSGDKNKNNTSLRKKQKKSKNKKSKKIKKLSSNKISTSLNNKQNEAYRALVIYDKNKDKDKDKKIINKSKTRNHSANKNKTSTSLNNKEQKTTQKPSLALAIYQEKSKNKKSKKIKKLSSNNNQNQADRAPLIYEENDENYKSKSNLTKNHSVNKQDSISSHKNPFDKKKDKNKKSKPSISKESKNLAIIKYVPLVQKIKDGLEKLKSTLKNSKIVKCIEKQKTEIIENKYRKKYEKELNKYALLIYLTNKPKLLLKDINKKIDYENFKKNINKKIDEKLKKYINNEKFIKLKTKIKTKIEVPCESYRSKYYYSLLQKESLLKENYKKYKKYSKTSNSKENPSQSIDLKFIKPTTIFEFYFIKIIFLEYDKEDDFLFDFFKEIGINISNSTENELIEKLEYKNIKSLGNKKLKDVHPDTQKDNDKDKTNISEEQKAKNVKYIENYKKFNNLCNMYNTYNSNTLKDEEKEKYKNSWNAVFKLIKKDETEIITELKEKHKKLEKQKNKK